MNLSDDKKLESFLKENRPLHPRHSEREREKIWAKILAENQLTSFRWRQWLYGFSATVATIATIAFITPQLQPAPAHSTKEVTLVDESLELKFLESGELYEVSDLLSIAK